MLDVTTPPARPAVRSWAEVLRTGNLSPGVPLDTVSRWLIITRASVLSMTLTSAAIGGLLAAAEGEFSWLPFVLAAAGLLLCHAGNNMTNDLFDFEAGVDTPDYARAQYAPHPLLGGLVSKRTLVGAIVSANVAAGAIALSLTLLRGWPVLAFAGAGFFISFFYVARPLRLKHHGLGEPAVFVVWGPLMIGGTYFAVRGDIRPEIFLACIPYALVVTTVLIGKHIDKYAADKARNIRTLPVILGEKAALRLNQALMISFYAIVAILILTKTVGPFAALTVFAIPRLINAVKSYSRPRPEKWPNGAPVGPLYYVGIAFYHNKLAGILFVLGLILNLIVPVQLPF